MPTQSREGLTSQDRTSPHLFGLYSLTTCEAQMPPGAFGTRARRLVLIMGKLPGTGLGEPLQPSLEKDPSYAWYMSSMDSASLCLWSSASCMPLSLSKFINPGQLIYSFFKSFNNIVVDARIHCPEPATTESKHSIPQLLECYLLKDHSSVSP